MKLIGRSTANKYALKMASVGQGFFVFVGISTSCHIYGHSIYQDSSDATHCTLYSLAFKLTNFATIFADQRQFLWNLRDSI